MSLTIASLAVLRAIIDEIARAAFERVGFSVTSNFQAMSTDTFCVFINKLRLCVARARIHTVACR